MPGDPVLELVRVTKAYGEHRVVDDVSVAVAEGETLVLLGTSGSGKSTTLKIVNRLVEPSSGHVRLFGTEATEQDPVSLRRRIGYVIQHIGLFPHLTVRQNVGVVPSLLGWPSQRTRQRVDELLEIVGLPTRDYGTRFPAELSGGQRQRIGLARALAGDPPLVLLDEPFGALDPILRRQLQDEFKRVRSSLKKTMVLVTHDVSEAVRLGDRICLLDAGRVQQIGSAQDLLFEPATPFVRAFFDPGRLQLELMATQVESIVELMDRENARSRDNVDRPGRAPILASTPLAELFERADIEDDTPLAIETGTTSALVTRARLLDAFLRFRSRSKP